MPTDGTISSASVKGLLCAVTQCGADAGALSQAAGLDSTQLKDPDGRVHGDHATPVGAGCAGHR